MKRVIIGFAAVLVLTILCVPASAHNYAAPGLYMIGLFENVPYPVASDAEMAQLLAMLKTDDAELRAIAASALGQSNNPKAVEPLIAALRDKSSSVRGSATFAFCKLKDKRAVKPLVDMLKAPGGDDSATPSDPVAPTDGEGEFDAIRVSYALACMGPEAISEAKKALRAAGREDLADGLYDTAMYIGGMTGQQLPPPSPDDVIGSLTSKDRDTRREAISMAEGVADPRIAEALLVMLKSVEDEVSDKAAYALACGNAAFVLDELIAIAKDKTSKARPLAFMALSGQNDARVTELVLAALKDPKTQGMSVRAVGKGSDPKVISAAADALKTAGDWDVLRVVDALISSGGAVAVQALVQAMKTGQPSVGGDILNILNNESYMDDYTPDARFLDGFIALLNIKDSRMRCDTLRHIGLIGDPRAAKYVLPLLNKPDTRSDAISALGHLKDPSALKPLIALLKIQTPGLGYNPLPDRLDLTGALANYGPMATPSLLAAMKDKDPKCRVRAILVFTRTKDPRAVDPLIAALKDPSLDVRGSAAGALGRQGDPRAVAPLIGMLKDPSPQVRATTANALRSLKDPRAADALALRLKDPDVYAKACAAVALGILGDARAADPVIHLLKSLANKEGLAEANAAKLAVQAKLNDLWLPAIEAAGNLKDKRALKPIVDSLPEDCSMSTFENKTEEGMSKSRETKITAMKQIIGQDFGHGYYRWTAYVEYAK